jgi:hypothetical protein
MQNAQVDPKACIAYTSLHPITQACHHRTDIRFEFRFRARILEPFPGRWPQTI